jgi:hypothetical protein
MNKNNKNIKNNTLKFFFIKLISITFAIIVIINVTYNLILADKMDNINKLLSLTEKENIVLVKEKIRSEIKDGLKKKQILNKEDAQLINKLFNKIKNEIKEAN